VESDLTSAYAIVTAFWEAVDALEVAPDRRRGDSRAVDARVRERSSNEEGRPPSSAAFEPCLVRRYRFVIGPDVEAKSNGEAEAIGCIEVAVENDDPNEEAHSFDKTPLTRFAPQHLANGSA